jgi:hypothetical protein
MKITERRNRGSSHFIVVSLALPLVTAVEHVNSVTYGISERLRNIGYVVAYLYSSSRGRAPFSMK